MTPIVGAGFIMSECNKLLPPAAPDCSPALFVKKYSLKRTIVRAGDEEKGETPPAIDTKHDAESEDEKKAITDLPVGELEKDEKQAATPDAPELTPARKSSEAPPVKAV